MSLLKRNRCQVCGKCAIYNFENEYKGTRCNAHREVGMRDVVNPKCQYTGCSVRPTFNLEGYSRPIYCATHRKDGMVNVKDSKCKQIGCRKTPMFNLQGEKKGVYCSNHRHTGMINVKSRKCHCGKKAYFRGDDRDTYRCYEHKEEGMEKFSKSSGFKCQHYGCRFRVISPPYCHVHKV
jgi:hypothetical protein